MVPSGVLFVSLLLAQAPAAIAPANASPPAASPLVSVKEPLGEDAPEKLITEAIEPTDHDALTGEPHTLVAVLGRAGGDRDRQLRATVAYWQLSASVANYHFRQLEVDYLRQIEGFESSASEGAGNAAPQGDPLRISAADAKRGEAQLEAIVAQHSLATWLSVPASAPLPLPVDRPHVNAYRTYYQQLFPSGGSLALRRIDETLPIRRQEIAIRARAVRRAEEMLDLAETAYISGNGSRRDLLSALHRLSSERQLFVEAVRKYNTEIGEYAITVARPGAPPRDLVAMMLIDYVAPPQASPPPNSIPSTSVPGMSAQPGSFVPGGFNQPATYNAPITVPLTPNTPRLPNGTPIRYGEPTLAPPKVEVAGPQVPDVTPAVAKEGDPGWRSSEERADQPEAAPVEKSDSEPGIIEVPEEAAPIPTTAPGEEEPTPAEEPEQSEDTSESQQVLYSPDEDARTESLIARTVSLDTAAYSELSTLSAKLRAQRLAAWAESESNQREGGLGSVTLGECLDQSAISSRSNVVAAYWQTWRAARNVAICTWHLDEIESLTGMTNDSGASNDAWNKQQLLLSIDDAEANRLKALAELKRARGDLVSRLLNWPSGTAPVIASPPHAGGYNLKASTQSSEISGTRDFTLLVEKIPREHAVVVDYTTAVLGSDVERKQAKTEFAQGTNNLELLLDLMEQQVAAEHNFTESVTDYNTSISQYVDLVVPPTVSTDVFLKASVLRK